MTIHNYSCIHPIRSQKHDQIRAEKRIDTPSGYNNQIEITIEPKQVDEFVERLRKIPDRDIKRIWPASLSISLIDENWSVDFDTFLPPNVLGKVVRPSGKREDWDTRILAAMSILSECTQGQGEHMGELLSVATALRMVDKRKKNKTTHLIEQDVEHVINDNMAPFNTPIRTQKAEEAKRRGTTTTSAKRTCSKPERTPSKRPTQKRPSESPGSISWDAR
ncbi:hypothetical protein BU23DRAFT_573507 [Bimuria novae-zelandiae CBS 107.79]|uniref:Uncharacterized protein n=1 Tax=Bimuria novae-zelandiae CBS 107.79 TaxID=1447943 RepID=A0A6A5UPL4_9PLEO|nr:hypothetical protein BU23DRAFT_573507 [Bimuria novae-zelandiae CBS 107.79]